jgi:hypothetical protein
MSKTQKQKVIKKGVYNETKNRNVDVKGCPFFENPNGKCALMDEVCERLDANDFGNFETCYIFECRDLFTKAKIVVVT